MTTDGVEGAGRPGHPAAYARNWKTVLLADASVGVVVTVVGVALTILWNPVIGGLIGSLGMVYLLLVARRARQWAAWRRDAGL